MLTFLIVLGLERVVEVGTKQRALPSEVNS